MSIRHLAPGGCLKASPISFGMTTETGGHIAYVLDAALLAHDAARVTGLRRLEGLALDDVAAGDHELITLPIRPGGPDAAPGRTVLRSRA